MRMSEVNRWREGAQNALGHAALRTAQGAARLATRSAGYVLEGEALRVMRPVSSRVSGQARLLQDRSACTIELMASRLRRAGMDYPAQTHAVARQLERTADYIRYRPLHHMVRDCARSRTMQIAAAATAGYLIYRLWGKNSH